MINGKKSKTKIAGGDKIKAADIRKAKEQLEFEKFSAEAISSTIGKNRSFAMTEAHKRLRTNVMFSFADDESNTCRVIGVTSAVAHEGKSTTSMNLAYDLMKAGKKTLLIDADMRLSRIAKFLGVEKAPGLSNLLVGRSNGEDLVQYSPVQDNLAVMTCGNFTPNPTELLASKRFEMMIDSLKQIYEYIVLDLPPVIEVSDALIASKHVDGMIMVVRQEYVDRRLIDDAIHQLRISGVRIIGFVMTCVNYGPKYGKYSYKKYGYKKYGYKKYRYKQYQKTPYTYLNGANDSQKFNSERK